MAASLLRLGRLGSLKCLLRESWGTQRTPFVAALCTKADVPPKTAKKAKAAKKAQEKAPEPEPEPFDNTTYKNLQHHLYNMYTFADMDVEMSKHRLPQPSSGRPSPSH
ncbi:NADH dehydrogenase [ubiquinone] flavoprotein 3, mitochondrial-like isoform X2 [Myxocyprinus asiaticus]|uniref:NADH dehydrogenase [ubiquinone] flavoprotein 3, mitochondrial-like isoform X2 n=1 Tax=Myxocyprinus asiaticus TaxID=70543 RepID=UPI002223BD08|nr:NADH dehydrogenase [ubiquinone] flavoprotein 3, mitochondrial-like isoform X2 [Myxocyprinus asiaticus]